MSDQITRRRATRRSAASEAGLRVTGVAGSDMAKAPARRMDEFGGGPYPTYFLNFLKETLQPQIGAVAPTVARAGNTATRYNQAGFVEIINAALPRFDYDPATKLPLGLLVEEARTNIVLRSAEFDSASWTKTDATISADAVTSPAGTLTGDKFVEAATSAFHVVVQAPAAAGATGEYWTLSVYAKAGERTSFTMQEDSTGFATQNARFNLATGAVEAPGGGAVGTIQSVGNGWYRCMMVVVSNGNYTAVGHKMYLQSGSYAGDGSSGLYIWGAQIEAGRFPTSHIPTTTASVVRAADVVSVATSNIPSFSNVTLGMVCKASCPTLPVAGEWRPMVVLDDGDSDDYLGIIFGDATDCAVESVVATVGDGVYPTRGSRLDIRIAGSWIVGNVNGSQNGKDEGYTYNAPSLPTVTTMHIGHVPASGSDWLNGHVQYIQYFPRTFTTAELQALSQ